MAPALGLHLTLCPTVSANPGMGRSQMYFQGPRDSNRI